MGNRCHIVCILGLKVDQRVTLTLSRFAMLTGLPPFQATSQDEIYRKAKGIEYDWPGIGPNARRCHNDIPSEAKDLVARLLKVDAEARPNPDDIVGHAFFSMHNGNAMPLTLDPSCRRQKPSWLLNQAPRGDVMDGIAPRLELGTLAKDCGVGRLKDNLKPYGVVGENVELSLYKECVAEERAEKSPEVPLPMDKVYTSIRSLKSWPQERLKNETPSSTTIAHGCVESEPCKPETEIPSEPILPTRTIQLHNPGADQSKAMLRHSEPLQLSKNHHERYQESCRRSVLSKKIRRARICNNGHSDVRHGVY